uniref:Uncharacterized protein n=1 Tax=Peromyscus maniculatus bairdii TaxID=230844 RepID=A0A8C8W6K9_PERMB
MSLATLLFPPWSYHFSFASLTRHPGLVLWQWPSDEPFSSSLQIFKRLPEQEDVEKIACVSRHLNIGGWSDGSVVKSSSRGPDVNSQQPNGSSQPSPVGPDALFWH